MQSKRVLLAVLLLSIGLGVPMNARAEYEIGLSMYSLRQLFQSGELHALDYPAFAKETFGITKIDVWDGGFPDDRKNDSEFFKELKQRADLAGSEIFLVMTGVVDAVTDQPVQLKANGLAHQFAVDQAVLLGADYVRVFLKANDAISTREAIHRCLLALRPLADYAATRDVIIVIEPGTSKRTKLGRFLAQVVDQLDHPNCRLMPDFGKMQGTDVVQGTIDMMPYTEVVSAKTHNFDAAGEEMNLDYAELMKAVQDSGFSGIIAIEYEGEKMEPIKGVRATQALLEKYRN
ncbi:MAG: TIM barrel protein [Verrucomicrobiota bacterium]